MSRCMVRIMNCRGRKMTDVLLYLIGVPAVTVGTLAGVVWAYWRLRS